MSHFLFGVGKEKASVVDGMKWNQPLLRGMPRLVDDSGRRANKVGRSEALAWERRTVESHRPQAWGLQFCYLVLIFEENGFNTSKKGAKSPWQQLNFSLFSLLFGFCDFLNGTICSCHLEGFIFHISNFSG